MSKSLSKEKISHTILEFGRELVDDLPDNHSKEELENSMTFIVAVWNAVTLDSWGGGSEHQDMLRAQMAPAPQDIKHLIDRLIKRKHRYFGTDERGVGRTWVIYRNGEYVFGCDARANSRENLETTIGSMH